MEPLLKKVLLRFAVFLITISLSSWLFVLVEYTENNDAEAKYQMLRSLYESMSSKYNMSIEEFNSFSNVAYEALSEPKLQWTYNTAVRFVFQASTTIGYGFVTPQTSNGQLLCIFVGLLGIPVTMLAFKSIGELITKGVNKVIEKFESKLLERPEPNRMQIKSAVLLVSLMAVLIVVNGSLMMPVFNWSLVEGVYFWFITLTTIGFGDYVPVKSQRIWKLSINISQDHEAKKKSVATKPTLAAFTGIFYTFYLILCLCIVSSVLNSIVAAIEESKFRKPCPGCIPRKTRDHSDNARDNTPEQRDTGITYLGMENFGFQKKANVSSLSETDMDMACASDKDSGKLRSACETQYYSD